MAGDDIVLNGFRCRVCEGWTSLAKGERTCRFCGAAPPTLEERNLGELITALRIVTTQHDAMAETLARTHARCSQLLDVSRAAKRLVDGVGGLNDLETEVGKLRALEGAS